MFEESRLGAKNSLAFQHFSAHSASAGVDWSRVLGDRGHDNDKCVAVGIGERALLYASGQLAGMCVCVCARIEWP